MKQHNQNLIVINGRTYDARSGLQVQHKPHAAQAVPSSVHHKKVFSDIAPAGPQKIPPHAVLAQRKPHNPLTHQPHGKRHASQVVAKKLHRAPERAHTLLRSGLQRPQTDGTLGHPRPQVGHRNMQHHSRLQRAGQAPHVSEIQRYAVPAAKHSTAPSVGPQQPQNDIKASVTLTQLHATKPAQSLAVAAPAQELQGSALKEHLIQERLAEAPVSREERFQEHQHKVNSFFSKQPRFLTAIAGTLGVLLLVAYVTYLNMPGISLRIAASRAGFAAAMPGYTPSGYGLNGPVNYSPGQVSLMFGSNTNEQNFTLMQKQSNWDTQALLDNHVAKKTDNYLTYQEKGLTIFMYDGKASWVNGGVWYNIDGSAKLSSDQILKIATSM